MPGSIVPLPVMQEEAEEKARQEEAAKQQIPKSVVVRYGYQKLIAELPWGPTQKPGCGTKVVIRTDRGTELADVLTSTCPNSGCGHSVSRQEMLDYIERSGGKDFPFSTNGKILRVATAADTQEQRRLDEQKPDLRGVARRSIAELRLPMRLLDAEPLLGGERIIFYYTADQWVDFRALVRQLADEFQTRIELHQVNAREEARIVADYERCGQHCCCKQFLKVLKPVPMKAAKMQKATLDPTKISGRCGRLMCCLRYEQETYEELRKKLPRRGTRVITDEGTGTVVDGQILTQLALVKLDNMEQRIAVPVEGLELAPAEGRGKPAKPGDAAAGEREAVAGGEAAAESGEADGGDETESSSRARRGRRSRRGSDGETPATTEGAQSQADATSRSEGDAVTPDEQEDGGSGGSGKRRRRRRRRPSGGESGEGHDADSGGAVGPEGSSGEGEGGSEGGEEGGDGSSSRRRRRRRRRPRGGSSGDEGGGSDGNGSSGGDQGGGDG